MVEGHSVHRIAHRHSRLLVGHKFKATSPNGRFKEGAKDINGKVLRRTDAKGKQLFYWFSNEGKSNSIADLQNVKDLTIVNIHFGMSGQFPTYNIGSEPPTTNTTRLKLVRDDNKIVGYVSAMTLISGGMEIFHNRFGVLGEDPLREDSDPVALYEKIQSLRPKGNSNKTIGQLLMDQAFFPGVGNIYRAECLFVAGVWPNAKAQNLTMEEFTLVWNSCVKLLQMGFQKGSIITVDEADQKKIKSRRYIYNRRTCARCSSKILSWDVNKRTCYACPQCQKIGQEKNMDKRELPLPTSRRARKRAGLPDEIKASMPKAILNKYASSSVKDLKALCKSYGLFQKGKKKEIIRRLLDNDEKLESSIIKTETSTVEVKTETSPVVSNSETSSPVGVQYKNFKLTEIREICKKLRIRSSGKKVFLISLIEKCLKETTIDRSLLSVPGKGTGPVESYLSAFYEKMEANEKRNVEHVADLDFTSITKENIEIDASLMHLTPDVLAQSRPLRISQRNRNRMKNVSMEESNQELVIGKRKSSTRNSIYKNKRVK